MTRQVVYASAAIVFLAAMAMSIAAISIPRWISWDSPTPNGGRITYTLGLHARCNSYTGRCEKFPEQAVCHTTDRYFCSMWKSVAFLMSFSVLLEAIVLVMYMSILGGGRKLRERGWKPLAWLLLLCGLAQFAAMSIMTYLYENDDRFFVGWRLDTSWVLCTISWSLCFLLAQGITMAGHLIPPEGGYELLVNSRCRS